MGLFGLGVENRYPVPNLVLLNTSIYCASTVPRYSAAQQCDSQSAAASCANKLDTKKHPPTNPPSQTQNPSTQPAKNDRPLSPLHPHNRPNNHPLPHRRARRPINRLPPLPPPPAPHPTTHPPPHLHLARLRRANPFPLRRFLPLQLFLHLHVHPTYKRLSAPCQLDLARGVFYGV